MFTVKRLAAAIVSAAVLSACAGEVPPPVLSPAKPVVVEVPVESPPVLITLRIPTPVPCAAEIPPPVAQAELADGADIFAAARAVVLELLDLRAANARLRASLSACAE